MDNSKYDLHIAPDIHAPAGRLTMIAGDAATGKTKLAKALVKEAIRMRPRSHVLVIDTQAVWSHAALKADFTKKEIDRIMVSAKHYQEDMELLLLGKSGVDGVLGQISKEKFDCSLIVIDDLNTISSSENVASNKIRHLLNQIADDMRPMATPLVVIATSKSNKGDELVLSTRLDHMGYDLLLMADMAYETTGSSYHEDHVLRNSKNIPVGTKISYRTVKDRRKNPNHENVEVWYDYTSGRSYLAEELEFSFAEETARNL